MSAPNAQPVQIGSMKAPSEHAPIEPVFPAIDNDEPGDSLHTMNPKPSTPAPVGAGQKNVLH